MPYFLRCSLSGAYMTDPVIVCSKDPPQPLAHGVSYERSALQKWMETSKHAVRYVSNEVLRKVVEDYRQKQERRLDPHTIQ